jgi:D-alanyl-lipoteichoic acid acyltransferase DltB (MBOAT superfamily)
VSNIESSRLIAGAPAAVASPAAAPAEDPRVARSRPHLTRYLTLLGQLGVLFVVFAVFNVEEPAFLLLSAAAFGGFAVHYWVPFRHKETCWLWISVAGAFVLLEPLAAVLLFGIGLALYALLASPLTYRTRVVALVACAAALMYARTSFDAVVPAQFWPVFGAVFMFRMMIYLYDLRHMKGTPRLRDYASYFFMLPNYYFLLFPVVDYQTLRKSYYQRDIHDIAQQGITWMTRGAIQLLLYRLIYHYKGPAYAPDAITSLGGLFGSMVLTYLLYLRVSGQFHIIIGMMHLFGYDLPETHRKYLLAQSLTDFWRRINIYWKDFMVKLVYFPVYFRLRRSGDTRAQVVATGCVFFTTWLLHSYQWFWLRGEWLFTWPDLLFWTVLGGLVTVNLLMETRGRKPARGSASRPMAYQALQVAGTFVLITFLWSMWNAPSMGVWFDVLTWWQVG